MTAYIGRRFFYMVITMVAVSVVGFAIIKLPPGDYLTYRLQRLELSGTTMSEAELEGFRKLYGLDQPDYIQYLKWVANLIRGNLGRSHQWNRPVTDNHPTHQHTKHTKHTTPPVDISAPEP